MWLALAERGRNSIQVTKQYMYPCLSQQGGGPPVSSYAPGVFRNYVYNHAHAHRPRLEKLFYLDLFRSSSGNFKPLLNPDGGSRGKTAVAQPF